MGFSLKELIPSCREKSPGTRGRGRHPGANVVPAAYHAGLPLGVGLLDPAQLRQREDGGDGVGERELVVTARGPLQLQTWGGGRVHRSGAGTALRAHWPRDAGADPRHSSGSWAADLPAHLGAGAPSEDYQAPRAGEPARLEAGAGSVSEKLRQWAGSPHTPLTRDAEAAGVEGSTLRGGDVDLQAELLQGPAVGLGHVLPGGGDVRLRHKQAAQTHVDVLWEAAAW